MSLAVVSPAPSPVTVLRAPTGLYCPHATSLGATPSLPTAQDPLSAQPGTVSPCPSGTSNAGFQPYLLDGLDLRHRQPVSWMYTAACLWSCPWPWMELDPCCRLAPSPLASDSSTWMVPGPGLSLATSGSVDGCCYSPRICSPWSDPVGQHPLVRAWPVLGSPSALGSSPFGSRLTAPWCHLPNNNNGGALKVIGRLALK